LQSATAVETGVVGGIGSARTASNSGEQRAQSAGAIGGEGFISIAAETGGAGGIAGEAVGGAGWRNLAGIVVIEPAIRQAFMSAVVDSPMGK
jgi:hypothetical protein